MVIFLLLVLGSKTFWNSLSLRSIVQGVTNAKVNSKLIRLNKFEHVNEVFDASFHDYIFIKYHE